MVSPDQSGQVVAGFELVIENLDDARNEVARGGRIGLRAAGIEEELRVREARDPLVREDEGEGGLADAAHAAQAGEDRAGGGRQRAECFEVLLPPDEALGTRRERVEAAAEDLRQLRCGERLPVVIQEVGHDLDVEIGAIGEG